MERYYGCEIRLEVGRYKVYRDGRYVGSSPTNTGARRVARWIDKPETMPREENYPETPCSICGSYGHFTHNHSDTDAQ